MRALTEEETKVLFAKLANYTGTSLKNLIAPLDDSPNADRYVFRLHQSRCYYVLLSIANLATSIARDQLLSLGTCLGMLQPTHLPSHSPIHHPKQLHPHTQDPQLTLPRKIHQNPQIPPPHHRPPHPRRARPPQALDQAQRRDALPVRRPHPQSARRAVVGRLPGAPGHRGVQHERYAAGLWGDGQEHAGGETAGSDGDCGV